MLGLFERLQSFRPLLAAHVNHAQIGIRRSRLWIEFRHTPEVTLRLVQPVLGERLLSALKNPCGIILGRTRRRGLRSQRSRQQKQNKTSRYDWSP